MAATALLPLALLLPLAPAQEAGREARAGGDPGPVPAEEIAWERVELSSEFTTEGVALLDADRDGALDVLAGPWLYLGPELTERREVRAPRTFDPHGYAEEFLHFAGDVDEDGWPDVVTVGFPGGGAHWRRNPGRAEGHWEAHLAVPRVDGESPAFADVDGDGRGELAFHVEGVVGLAGPDPAAPERPWTFRPISERVAGLGTFSHGLGVGDVSGDGRVDVLLPIGWWEQPGGPGDAAGTDGGGAPARRGGNGEAAGGGDPEEPEEKTDEEGNRSAVPPIREDPPRVGGGSRSAPGSGAAAGPWRFHPAPFHGAASERGGAQMLVLDADGDGDADVVTSLDAHGYGLSWFEQRRSSGGGEGGARVFAEHPILPPRAAEARDELSFSQLHALAAADVDGDGALDVVTGKRWWAHGPDGDPEPNASPVLYWFRSARGDGGSGDARFEPRLVDDRSGAGVQIACGDLDGDGRVDVATANKRGSFAHLQRRRPARRGSGPTLDFEDGTLRGWTATGDAFEGQPVRGDRPSARGREPSRHEGEWWIGGYELHGDGRTGTLTSEPFEVEAPWASFLVAGGLEARTRVEVLPEEGEVPILAVTGVESETLQRAAVDLSDHLGARIRVRLVDELQGDWGHVSFDDFRFHAEEPSPEPEPRLPPLVPLDRILHAGLAPDDALRAMEAPPGFQVDLIAAEPDLHQPVALAVDARGRIWVAEAYSYPERPPEGEGRDRIVVLEDLDLDGRYETRTVFADGLNLVSGLEVGFGGAFVGAAPYLLFVPDRDDDLVPDGPPEVLLDGFGYQDTHETLNSFRWGPDGWLYGCHGVFTHSVVGPSGAPADERVPLNAGFWRFHPTERRFEVFAWGTSNPWGIDFDARGEAFATACVIPHLWHVVQGARFERQSGSHFGAHVYGEIGTAADHVHWSGAEDDPWSGNLRSGDAGGGHAHCGALVYQGGSFPEEYAGSFLTCNLHGNRVNRDVLEPRGSGHVGRHAEDLLLARDRWFRGVALETAPDGSVLVADWYDDQACHLTDPLRWDRTNGRLYRLSHGAPRAVEMDLPSLPDVELARLQLHENELFARRARLLLQERGADEAARRALRDVLAEHPDGTRGLRALWTLSAAGALDEDELVALLDGGDAHVRAWAVRLLADGGEPSPAALAALERRAEEDPSPVVRRNLASALQRLPEGERLGIASRLARRGEDAGDPNVPLLVWYGIEPLVARDPERMLALARESALPDVARFAARRAAAPDGDVAALVRSMAEGGRAWIETALPELERALRDRGAVPMPAGWPQLHALLAEDPDRDTRERALAVAAAFGDADAFPALRALLADREADRERRLLALDALVRERDAETSAMLLALLDEPAMRSAAIRALSELGAPETPEALLDRWPELDAGERRDGLHALASRPPWARALLDALASGRVERAEVGASAARALQSLGDEEVEARARALLGAHRATPEERERRIDELRARLGPEVLAGADPSRGRAVYARSCESCHVLFGEGGEVGPELTGSNRADLDYVLRNLVDPSAEVGRDYLATLVWREDGTFASGIVARETDEVLVLRTETGEVRVEKDEIEERRLSELSLMPDGLLDGLSEDEIRDLVAYLASPRQVPLPEDAEPAASR